MDASDMAYFNSLIEGVNANTSDLEDIKDECVSMFKDAIQTEVYNHYSPSWYSRSNQLIDSVTARIEGNNILVYIDDSVLNYNSWINFIDTGKEVGSAIPYWVESGHNGAYGTGEYRDFEPRKYLEKAQQLVIEKYKEYGITVEIVNDIPARV